jgi:hypothetical protein
VPAEQGIFDGGNHRVVVAKNPGKELLSTAQGSEQVGADLLSECPGRAAFLAEFTQGARKRGLVHRYS